MASASWTARGCRSTTRRSPVGRRGQAPSSSKSRSTPRCVPQSRVAADAPSPSVRAVIFRGSTAICSSGCSRNSGDNSACASWPESTTSTALVADGNGQFRLSIHGCGHAATLRIRRANDVRCVSNSSRSRDLTFVVPGGAGVRFAKMRSRACCRTWRSSDTRRHRQRPALSGPRGRLDAGHWLRGDTARRAGLSRAVRR